MLPAAAAADDDDDGLCEKFPTYLPHREKEHGRILHKAAAANVVRQTSRSHAQPAPEIGGDDTEALRALRGTWEVRTPTPHTTAHFDLIGRLCAIPSGAGLCLL